MNRKYRHLSQEERYEIKRMHDLGVSINKIARHLTRSKSAISMELKRNKVKGKYMPCVAQEKYKKRMCQQELLKIEKIPRLLNYIKNAMIHKKWSPDAIAGKLKLDKNTDFCISTESIYRFVYTSPVAAKLKLYSYLPSKRFKRQERGKRRQRIMISQRISIHQRDAIAMQKVEVGVLTLLPEKTKEAVTNIIPDDAKELDKIPKEYTKSLHDSYSTIISGYAEEIQKYKTEIDQVSHGVTAHITKHISSVDQKLDEYSKKLSASAAYVVECSNYNFLKNMCLVVLFSAIVAGGTAYLVTTKFPRYLTVTGANNVTIQNCDVSVLGKAKDPDNLMDKMTKKK